MTEADRSSREIRIEEFSMHIGGFRGSVKFALVLPWETAIVERTCTANPLPGCLRRRPGGGVVRRRFSFRQRLPPTVVSAAPTHGSVVPIWRLRTGGKTDSPLALNEGRVSPGSASRIPESLLGSRSITMMIVSSVY